jgi:predicted Zn-dependent protease
VRQQFQALGGQNSQLAPTSIQRTTINGLPAVYATARVNNGNSQVDVVVVGYEFARDQAFHFATIAPAGRSGTFEGMFRSMRRITQSEAGAVVPRKLQVVTVARGDTVASLSRRMAFDNAQEDRFRVLNALSGGDSLTPGQKVKLVVRGR